MSVVVVGAGATMMRMLGGDAEAPIKDTIAVAPALTGPGGRAWLADVEAGRRQLGVGPGAEPKNFAAQFIEIADALALDRVQAVVARIVDRKLSPDVDWRYQWCELFGYNMMKDRPGAWPPREVAG